MCNTNCYGQTISFDLAEIIYKNMHFTNTPLRVLGTTHALTKYDPLLCSSPMHVRPYVQSSFIHKLSRLKTSSDHLYFTNDLAIPAS